MGQRYEAKEAMCLGTVCAGKKEDAAIEPHERLTVDEMNESSTSNSLIDEASALES